MYHFFIASNGVLVTKVVVHLRAFATRFPCAPRGRSQLDQELIGHKKDREAAVQDLDKAQKIRDKVR